MGCCGFFLFLFFFKVLLVDVGLCRWWLSVFLRQWLLVAVVAIVVVGGCCFGSGGVVIVVGGGV